MNRSKRRLRSGPRICRAPSRDHRGITKARTHFTHHSSLPRPLSSHHSLGGSRTRPRASHLGVLPLQFLLLGMPFLSCLFSNLLVFLQKPATNSPLLTSYVPLLSGRLRHWVRSLICLSTPSFNKLEYLLNVPRVPGTRLEVRDLAMNEVQLTLLPF